MIGQKVTELKNGNQGNQATKQPGNLFIFFFFTKINVKKTGNQSNYGNHVN